MATHCITKENKKMLDLAEKVAKQVIEMRIEKRHQINESDVLLQCSLNYQWPMSMNQFADTVD